MFHRPPCPYFPFLPFSRFPSRPPFYWPEFYLFSSTNLCQLHISFWQMYSFLHCTWTPKRLAYRCLHSAFISLWGIFSGFRVASTGHRSQRHFWRIKQNAKLWSSSHIRRRARGRRCSKQGHKVRFILLINSSSLIIIFSLNGWLKRMKVVFFLSRNSISHFSVGPSD